ncbi:tyrosine-type recombinase/integrase [Nocardia noduli]|uniref:tyrosine-type recombinase/integrase n=1 Tax=Nocardia noduli TaxID=2815722 RepID=UPI001C2262D4|nr:site-specific integrase [Nocardia noduli]
MAEDPFDTGEFMPVRIAASPILTGFTASLAGRDDLGREDRGTYGDRAGHYLAWLRDTGGYDDALHSPLGRDRAVDAYLTTAVHDHGIAARTVATAFTVLTAFYRWLGLGTPATPRAILDPLAPNTLSPIDQRAVLRVAAARGPRTFAMIALGLDVGPRKTELAALDLTGLDLARWPGSVTLTDATGATRQMPIQTGTRAALTAWLSERRRLLRGHSEQRAVFLAEHAPHHRLAIRTVDDAIRAVGVDAGIDISSATLRATAEQRLRGQGLPLSIIATRLGHHRSEPWRDHPAPSPRIRNRLPDHEQLDLFGDPDP